MQYKKLAYLLYYGGLLLLAVIVLRPPLIVIIDAQTKTCGKFTSVLLSCQEFYCAHGRVPESIDEMIDSGCDKESFIDGWGSCFLYAYIPSDGVILITSLGSDRVIGGVGSESDITHTYRVRSKIGSIMIDDPHWVLSNPVSLSGK